MASTRGRGPFRERGQMPEQWVAWSTSEDGMLRAHYAERGPSWAGWAEVLQGRTRHAIINHAKKLGLHVTKRGGAAQARARMEVGGSRPSHPLEFEAAVGRRMADGMTPSQIDREMHWPQGRAASIISEAWRRDKERA